jgi:hypothetical protein
MLPCGDGLLGFFMNTKKLKFAKDYPIIHALFGFNKLYIF